MFARMKSDEEEMPSWLIEDDESNSKKHEQSPLLANAMTKDTSYGGQSQSSHSNVEENYGDVPPAKTENPWHVEPGSSDSDNESDEESADESVQKSLPVATAWPEEVQEDRPPAKTDGMGKKVVVRRSACHSFFILVQTSSCFGNLGMMATQLVPVFVCNIELLNSIVRSYLALFAFFFLIVELELPCLKKQSSSNWIFRGFMYTFLGTITLDQRTEMISEGVLAKTRLPEEYWNEIWASFYIYISSWWMIINGFVYFFLGLLCMRQVRDKCRKEYRTKIRKYADAHNEV